jgi:transposase
VGRRKADADEMDRKVAAMWNAGMTTREIADALGLGPHSNAGSYIQRARAAGYDLPYRLRRSGGHKFDQAEAA